MCCWSHAQNNHHVPPLPWFSGFSSVWMEREEDFLAQSIFLHLMWLTSEPLNSWCKWGKREGERERASQRHSDTWCEELILTKMTGRKLHINLLPQQQRSKSQSNDGWASFTLLCLCDWIAVHHLPMIFVKGFCCCNCSSCLLCCFKTGLKRQKSIL